MVGQNIGKYRVLDRVGRGGMGTVYRAIDETLHREVAIKVLNAELNDPEVAKRFRAEAITVARLSHPGIATIYELFQHEGQWLMVMEFVRGETLEHMVERMGPLSPQRSAELCMQTLAALAHAHSMGVVHRDLKPANLMITETGAIKIMDFGIARVSGTEHLTSAGFMMGTPAYMAPEQVLGHEIDARADLYAVGVVFYRLTAAKLPFRGDTPFAMAQSQVNEPPTPIGTHRGDLPPWVDQVIARSLAKAPDERFQSAVEFHESFARCLAGLPMATLYSSSAPTELLMTPPRAMPTGTMQRPIASAKLPGVTGGAVGASGQYTPVNQSSAMGGAEFETRVSESTPARTPASASGAQPVVVGVPSSAGQPSPPAAETRPGHAGAKKKSNTGMLAGVAVAVLVLVGVAAAYLMRSAPRAPQAAESTSAPETTIAAPVEPAAAASVPATSNPPGPATISGSDAAVSADPGSSTPVTPAPGAAPPPNAPLPGATAIGSASGRATTPSGGPASTAKPTGTRGAEAAAGRRGAAATFDDSLQGFTNLRVLIVEGRRATDPEALVNFYNGQIAILSQRGGSAIATIPYGSVAAATYVRARDPQWNTALPGPPANLDVPGGIFSGAKHWLTLQLTNGYWILRLDDSNWQRILQTIETRTSVQVARPRQAPQPN